MHWCLVSEKPRWKAHCRQIVHSFSTTVLLMFLIWKRVIFRIVLNKYICVRNILIKPEEQKKNDLYNNIQKWTAIRLINRNCLIKRFGSFHWIYRKKNSFVPCVSLEIRRASILQRPARFHFDSQKHILQEPDRYQVTFLSGVKFTLKASSAFQEVVS